MDYLGKFNQTFSEFLEDIIRVFPDDSELRMYYLAIQAAAALKPTLVAKVFRKRVAEPFGPQILARDESFFLSHDYDDMKNEFTQASKIIDKIKGYWGGMSVENREIVWKYFRVLVKLDAKITI